MIRKYLVILLFVFALITTKAQDFSGKDYLILKDTVKSILHKMEFFGTFSADGVKVNKKYTEEYKDLFFSDDAMLINDITELYYAQSTSYGLSEEFVQNKITLDLYTSIIEEYYKMGLLVNYNIADMNVLYPKKIKGEQNYYRSFVKVHKSQVGVFKNQKVVRYKGYQYLEIIFSKSQGVLGEFAIRNILSEDEMKQEIINQKVKGGYVGIGYAYTLNAFMIDNFNINPYENAGTFSKEDIPSKEYSLLYRHNFGKSFGIITGVGFGSFKSIIKTNEFEHTYSAEHSKQDIDGETYYPILMLSDFKQDINVKYAQIPLIISLSKGKPDKVMSYYNIGAVYKHVSKSTITLNGTAEYLGYYPQYPVILHNLDPELGYGFNEVQHENEEVEWDIQKGYFSAHVGLGLRFSIKELIFIDLGGFAQYNVTEINFSETTNIMDDYIGIFGKPKKVQHLEYGGGVKVFYKLK